MEESQISSEIQDLLAMPPYALGAIGIVEFLTVTLIFAGVIILFTSSSRPGRKSMLISLALSAVLLVLPFSFFDNFVDSNNKRGQEILMWCLPLAGSIFACIGSIGFFRFALSFKNDS